MEIWDQTNVLVKEKRKNSKMEKKMQVRLEEQRSLATKWKGKYEEIEESFIEKNEQSIEMQRQIEEWKSVAKDLEQKCLDVVHEDTPKTIRKVWVKNVGKKGE